jgi:hypothetical protein
VALLLTHYESGMAGIALAAYVVIRLRSRLRIVVLLTLAGAMSAFVLIWGSNFYYQSTQFGHYDMYWFNESRHGHVWLVLQRMATLPVTFLQPLLRNSISFAWLAGAFYLLPIRAMRRRPQLLLWGLLLLAIIGPLAIIDWIRSTNYLASIHYTYFATPAVFVLLSAAFADHPRPFFRHIIPVTAVVGCIVAIPQAYISEDPDWRQPTRYLDAHIQPGEPIVFTAGTYGSYFTGYLYLATSYYSHSFPRPIMLLDDPTPPATLRQLRQYPSIWLLKSSPLPPTSYFLPGFEVVDNQFFPNIGLLQRLRPIETIH